LSAKHGLLSQGLLAAKDFSTFPKRGHIPFMPLAHDKKFALRSPQRRSVYVIKKWRGRYSADISQASLFLPRSWYVFNVASSSSGNSETQRMCFSSVILSLLLCCICLRHIQPLSHWLRFESSVANKVKVEIFEL